MNPWFPRKWLPLDGSFNTRPVPVRALTEASKKERNRKKEGKWKKKKKNDQTDPAMLPSYSLLGHRNYYLPANLDSPVAISFYFRFKVRGN